MAALKKRRELVTAGKPIQPDALLPDEPPGDIDPVTALAVSSMGESMVAVSRDRRILGTRIDSTGARC